MVKHGNDDPTQIEWPAVLSHMLSVYRKGGNSRPYARLTLSQPVQTDALEGSAVSLSTGSQLGTPEIVGRLLNTASAGATQIDVLYNTSDRNKICRVGFLLEPSTDHCFPATGTVWLGEQGDNGEANIFHDYAYDPNADTLSDRTLRGFSIDESIHHVFGKEINELHGTMQTFKDYYGVVDYADRITWAALTKGDAGLERGNMDFSDDNIDDKGAAGA